MNPHPNVQRTLLGVRITSPAAATVAIHPPASGLAHAQGTVPTQRGEVGVAWWKSGRATTVRVDVPVNVRAEIELPAGGKVRVSGPGETRYVGDRDGHAVYSVGSGRVTLTAA
jgi:alpha-L-rhamnosidase